jgi:hypothetical protein
VSQSEEFNNERKLWVKRLIITAVLINRRLVETEAKPIYHFQQLPKLKVACHSNNDITCQKSSISDVERAWNTAPG